MKKEYRDAIISGVVIAIGGTIIISLIQGKVAWAYLFTFSIFYPIFKTYLIKRREARGIEIDV
jgi:heme O synthase-like polyprenyltransferase